MFKLISIFLLLAVSFQGKAYGNVIIVEDFNRPMFIEPKISSVWLDHAMDFVKLIDLDKIIVVAVSYLNDPEVLNFLTFVMSDDFKQLIWEFETMTEFKEAFQFLTEKGYDLESAINFLNEALNLPPFEKGAKRNEDVARGAGLKGLIEDIMATLPIDEIKKLFESKLETSPEIAELFETINSPEFMDIMKRMSKNPKFTEFKKVFEGYGFVFKYLCNLAKEVFGEYYQGVFCDNF